MASNSSLEILLEPRSQAETGSRCRNTQETLTWQQVRIFQADHHHHHNVAICGIATIYQSDRISAESISFNNILDLGEAPLVNIYVIVILRVIAVMRKIKNPR